MLLHIAFSILDTSLLLIWSPKLLTRTTNRQWCHLFLLNDWGYFLILSSTWTEKLSGPILLAAASNLYTTAAHKESCSAHLEPCIQLKLHHSLTVGSKISLSNHFEHKCNICAIISGKGCSIYVCQWFAIDHVLPRQRRGSQSWATILNTKMSHLQQQTIGIGRAQMLEWNSETPVFVV